MDNKLNLSYSTVSPIPTPQPVESVRSLFDTLEEKELRNRAAVTQHLDRLNAEVGPSTIANDYINNFKTDFNTTIQEYANRGDYAYMGKVMQNKIDSFIGDKNVRNLMSYWTETNGAINAIKSNENIDMLHKKILTADELSKYDDKIKQHVDLESGIYERPNIQTPFEKVKVPELLLSNLNSLKASSEENGFYKFLNSDNNKVDIPQAFYPFVHDEKNGEVYIDKDRAKMLTSHMLEENKDAMGYLVQDYVVKNKHLYQGQNLMEVVNNILNGTSQDAEAIKSNIIESQTNKLSEAYAFANKKNVEDITFVPGMMDKGGRGKPDDLATPPVVTMYNTIGIETEAGSNLKDHKTTLLGGLKSNIENVKSLAFNATDGLEGTYSKVENGNHIKVDRSVAEKDFNDLEYAVYVNDPETIEEIASSYNLTQDKIIELKDNANAYALQQQILSERYKQARVQVASSTTDPEIKEAVNFKGTKQEELINGIGLTIDEFERIEGISHLRKLDLLIKAVGLIPEIDATSSKTLDTQIGGKVAKGIYDFTRNLVNAFTGRNYDDVDANFIAALTPILLKVDRNSPEWDKLKEYRNNSKWREVKELEDNLQKSVDESSLTVSTGVATNIGYAGILPNATVIKDFKKGIKSRLTQSTFNSKGEPEYLLSDTKLYDATGKQIDIEKVLPSYILQQLSEDNIDIDTMIPASMLMDDSPLVKFTISYKDTEGNTKNIPLSMPVNKEGGVTNTNAEAYKNTPDYVINSMKNTLNRSGLHSMDFEQYGVRARKDNTGNIEILIKNGNGHYIPTTVAGERELKKRIINNRVGQALLRTGIDTSKLATLRMQLQNGNYNDIDNSILINLSRMNVLNTDLLKDNKAEFMRHLDLLIDATNN
jgi:hypothetical protein